MAQMNNGLIAEWRMNGNAYDSTGNGHNGTIKNVTFTTGKGGLPNTAAVFAGGDSSYIEVPYKSDLNIANYSICALVKPIGFYDGLCQGNFIFTRGIQYRDGAYALYHCDQYSDFDCYNRDTTKNVFAGVIGSANTGGGEWQYTPAIIPNTWYSVVLTFDGDTARVYVDGVLKSRYPSNTPIKTCNEGIIMGRNNFGVPTHPYGFKGLVDNIRLYNRALSDTEVVKYGTVAVDTPVTIDVAGIPAASGLELFPNPNSGNFKLTGDLRGDAPVSIEIMNIMGKVIYTRKVKKGTMRLNEDIRMGEDLPKGIYLLRLNCDGESSTLRFVSGTD